ncbi:hypothetical protein C8Q80DRAFT_1282310 [Daedaleopsis nitida]|nr:hypothetical protein C8Q80DRAFT_1282310 [Daedaleopsis nitida]
MTESQSIAERLKLEGNELFKRNAFSQAYQKYSEAIEHDNKNAVLYCNRAACALGLNRYIDASADATKATELDPGYAKAWGRLAKAEAASFTLTQQYHKLNAHERAVKSWQRAIAALPVENLTPTEEKLRTQYQEEFAAAKATVADLTSNPRVVRGNVAATDTQQLPWNVALRLMPDLQRTNTIASSAWVIGYAYTSWEKALTALKKGSTIYMGGQLAYKGELGVIEGFSNALTSDSRVFHISDSNFIKMYNEQMLFEINYRRAWSNSGAREVMVEAPKRLAAEGWDSVRPALSLTVRAWLMRAHFDIFLRNSIDVSLEFFTSALELLQWGSQYWKDVSFQDKGAIFQPTFIRAIKALRLDAYMKAYTTNPASANSKYPLKDLLAGADELIAEIDVVKGREEIYGEGVPFWLAFYRYQLGKAHAVRGFCYNYTAILLRQAHGMTDEVRRLYSLGAEAYRATGEYLPDDDEFYIWYMHCAFQMQYEAGAPTKTLLAHLDQIHAKLPGMKKIWGLYMKMSPDQRIRELQEDMKLRDELHAAIASGQIRQHELGNMMYKPGSGPTSA